MATQTVSISSPLLRTRSRPSPLSAEESASSPILRTRTRPPVQDIDAAKKTSADLWFIRGNYYDLTPFIASHPGGTTVLNMSKGLEDATPLMESYHAFANREYIYKTMEQYRVSYTPEDALTRTKTEVKYLFKQDGFYMTLVRRVRTHFGAVKEAQSVTPAIKTTLWWELKVSVLCLIFAVSYLLAFVLPHTSYLFPVVAGAVNVMIGFTAMHDASHFALGTRDSWKNKMVMRVWNSLALWDSAKWYYHHMIRHHSFTGDSTLDPDVVHAAPLIRKHQELPAEQYMRLAPRFMATWPIYGHIQTVIYAAVLNYGQVFAYHVKWTLEGVMWGLPIEKTVHFDKLWWETALSCTLIGTQLVHADWLASLLYFTAFSVCYGMCILADHDTFESAVENHVTLGEQEMDWGEIQVRHSSDFAAKGLWGRVFSEIFGSINVQIGHHLFPGVNHVHLRSLIPIIKQTCEEFNIPYASHDSLLGALLSVSKTMTFMNTDSLTKLEEKW